MGILIYFSIALIIFFFLIRKHENSIRNKVREGSIDLWAETGLFWKSLAIALAWFPFGLIWMILELIFNKKS